MGMLKGCSSLVMDRNIALSFARNRISSNLIRSSLILSSSASAEEISDDPPELTEDGLPQLKGDFDWDAKFGGDDDWITENVPGKIVLDDVTLAKQITELEKLEKEWRKERA